MRLLKEERVEIERAFHGQVKSPKELKTILPETVYSELKKTGNLSTICDNIKFYDATKYRPYDSAMITKFLTDDFDISATLEHIFGVLTPSLLIFIDFHFLIRTSKEDENGNNLKFQRASKASAFNKTIKLVVDSDFVKLCNEIRNINNAEFLNIVFNHHLTFFEFEESGFTPDSLLSLCVYIQKF